MKDADNKSQDYTTNDDIGYTNRIFVQALFPYRKPKDGTDTYIRRMTQGPTTVTLMSPHGLPYGKYPRLIMAYITTTALHNARRAEQMGDMSMDEARLIPLGSSLSQFIRTIGGSNRATGGKHGNANRLKEQLHRLITSTITIETVWQKGTKAGERGEAQRLIKEWDCWAETTYGSSPEGMLELSEEFFALLCDNPIPINLEVVHGLNKPRAIDLYLWITLKQFWLQKRGVHQYTFWWSDIEHQFSPEPLTNAVQRRDFRKEIKSCLESINALWPESGTTASTTDGVMMVRTSPSVPPKKSDGTPDEK